MGKNKLQKIIDTYDGHKFYTPDGFDDAVIGIEDKSMRLIYSVSKCINILIEGGMTTEDAIDYFTYNVEGSYIGVETPIWCEDYFI